MNKLIFKISALIFCIGAAGLGAANAQAIKAVKFSPPGGIYTTAQRVSLSCATAEVAIYYTRDGTVPNLTNNPGMLYSNPIPVGKTTTVCAIAVNVNGGSKGPPASARFTIIGTRPERETVAMPTITPDGGAFTGSVEVTLECATPGATIHYTTDGSDPVYYVGKVYIPFEPFTLTRSTTLKVRAYKTGFISSDVATANFAGAETVSPPTAPAGLGSGSAGTNYAYAAGGAVSDFGNPVQYQFDWGDGTFSGWLGVGTVSATKAWSAAGTYRVRAQARSVIDPALISPYSPILPVAILANTISIPQITSPPNGVTLASGAVTFAWQGSEASQYYLYVGSTPGTANLYNSGQMAGSVLARAVNGLPTDGRIIYVRLWSHVGGQWKYLDCSYTTFAGGGIAETVSTPTLPSGSASGLAGTSYSYGTGGAGSDLGNPVQYQFDWGDGTYSGWLTEGTVSASKAWAAAGAYNVRAQARCISNPSVASGYSAARTVVVLTPVTPVVVTPVTPVPRQISSPANGSVFNSATVVFTWAGTGVTEYRLTVGSALNGSDVFDSGNLAGNVLTQTVSVLPIDGRTLHVRLWSLINSAWLSNDYSYTASTGETAVETVSVPTVPSGLATGLAGTSYAYTSGGSLSDHFHAVQYQFDWGNGTYSGWLQVGTTSASNAWPAAGTYGVKVQARCVTNPTVVSAYSAVKSVTISSSASPLPGQITSPANGTTLTGSNVEFVWNAGNGVNQYYLFVGAAPGTSNLYNSNLLSSSVLTRTATGLPTDGRKLYVRLWSRVGMKWNYFDYSYTAFTP